ncbi:hypothetical protein BDZ97DRAFT_1757935 [Flammula alnicola]|nr:hypothetical protein BDZ97DRAFT_1757935 [Flammula alnicola]
MNPAEIAHGPILIGFTFNAVLLGVMMTQVYLYYTSFKKDKAWIKIFVAVLFGLDIFNTACGAAYLYKALIIHFDDPAYLNEVTWQRERELTKCPNLHRSRYHSITGGVTAILTPVEVAKAPHFIDLIKSKSKHKTGFERSDMLVDRIIRLTIQTGLITSVVALINLVVYLSDTTGLHLLFNFVLCKLYSNSLMSTLNSRGIWMSGPSGMSTGRETEDHATSMNNNYRPQIVQPPPMKPSEIISFNGKKHTEVYVNVESHELQDGTGMRSQLPLGKGAFDDKGRDF